uniref:Glucose-6-phosphate isomerase n=1 Tax=Ananas comosus var. bracteatus TaxID=296719 RepID=A0A6V7NVU5_ANACO|nr:unnamed protein product [Ananas comosus var. bracteatus]
MHLIGLYACFIVLVSMESNGKGVFIDGIPLPFETGEIDFGEPGTNGQHSFYQLIHQGRVIPCDFIGVVKSQQPVYLKGEIPDALAYGKTPEQLLRENVPNHLIPHRTFSGNRPSLSLLLPSLNAYNVGQLLAVYEHRIAVEGFICGGSTLSTNGVNKKYRIVTLVAVVRILSLQALAIHQHHQILPAPPPWNPFGVDNDPLVFSATPPPRHHQKWNLAIIMVVVLSMIIVITFSACLCYCFCRRRSAPAAPPAASSTSADVPGPSTAAAI